MSGTTGIEILDGGNDGETGKESSAWAASRQVDFASPQYRCVSCDEDKRLFELLCAPCGDFYCQECMQKLFQLATDDENYFPPRCCRQPIPLTSAKLYLKANLAQAFQKKSVGFRTGNRTYCFRPTCSSLIAPDDIDGDTATCPICDYKTCTICKGCKHDGDCPEDTATQQVLEVAGREEWQRCYNCRGLMELQFGCNHMRHIYQVNSILDNEANHACRCRCGAELWSVSIAFLPEFDD